MAKKKRRRLKKSVRRGCALLLALPILWGLVWLIGSCLARFSSFPSLPRFSRLSRLSSSSRLSSPSSPSSPSDSIIAERLDRLFQMPQRVDTALMALEVCDIASGRVLYSRHARRLAPPASCMKLLTAVAAIEWLGTDHTFDTRVVLHGQQQGDTFRGTVALVLDDDPMLESLAPLVDALCRQGIRRIEGDVDLQLMRTDTLRAHPTAATWDIPYHRLPPLLKGRERIRQDIGYLLHQRGIALIRQTADTVGTPSRTIYHHSTPLTDVLAPMLIHSSNIKADELFYHLGRTLNRPPLPALSPGQWLLSQAALAELSAGEPEADRAWPSFVINDGSGLSPDNRLTAHFLVSLLRYAWQRDAMRHILLRQALATPAHPERHGSLLGRMSAPVFRNKVFVKTGTLTTRALSSLAGYVQTEDGRWLAFAIINEGSPVMESRIMQDKVCRELVR